VTGTEVLGLGTDLVDVDRFRLALDRQGERLVTRLFSDAERDYAFRHRNPAPRLAARFGAKEAVMKALGVGLWKFALRDVEVVRLPSGQPTIALFNRAAELADARKVRAWHLTLTHTDTMAAATAIALGDGAIALGVAG
jgi:holo-[acyl-carrier protein] synthase